MSDLSIEHPGIEDASIEHPCSATAVVDALELGEGRLTRHELATVAGTVGRREALWRPILRHDREHRWYALLHRARNVEVWLLGWERGQDTRFHDHGGSSGAFYVAEGMLTEQYGSVESRSGLRRREHLTGRTVPFGPGYVHNLGNQGPGVATSVHAYSPPLSTMTYYRPDGVLLVPYQTLRTDGPDPGIDIRRAAGDGGYLAAPSTAVST